MNTIADLKKKLEETPTHPDLVEELETIQLAVMEAMERVGGCDHMKVLGHGTCSCPLNRVADKLAEQLEEAKRRAA